MGKLLINTASIAYMLVLVNTASVRVDKSKVTTKPGENVTLTCFGSESSLSFYIINSVSWRRLYSNGTALQLTNGFYPAVEADIYFQKGHYQLSYFSADSSYGFNLIINDVTVADSGSYVCSLVDRSNTVLSTAVTDVAVVLPVDQLQLALKAGELPVFNTTLPVGREVIALFTGDYSATCTASGYTKPVLTIFLNSVNVSTSPQSDVLNRNHSYSSTLTAELHIPAMTHEQSLVCEANIEGSLYPAERVAIPMRVDVEQPDIECEEFVHALGERDRSVKCKLTAPSGLTCDTVSWTFGDKTTVITPSSDAYTVPSSSGGATQIKAYCSGGDSLLEAGLTFSELTSKVFKPIYTLRYGTGENVHQHEVVIYEDMHGNNASNRAGVVKPSFVTVALELLIFMTSGTFH